VSALAEAIAKDFEPLGALGARVTTYVMTGEDARALGELGGTRDAIDSKATSEVDSAGRPYFALFGDDDADKLERVGRVLAAIANRGFIAALDGDLRWIEHVVWEGGPNAPNTHTFAPSWVRLALVASRMRDPSLLVRLALAPDDHFEAVAFSSTLLAAPDAASFFVRHVDAVRFLLRNPKAPTLRYLGMTKVDLAPIVDVIAGLACDARSGVRRAAIALLTRDAELARRALHAIASDDDRRPKERDLAEKALASLSDPA
jgi:hypothetical protein